MKETIILKKEDVKLNEPILIEGLPGLGLVGKISVTYLIRQLNGKLFARLYSPHFPYYVISDKKGSVRLLRCNFFYWKNDKPNGRDIILLTGDGQAQTIEGQYEVTSKILSFAQRLGVKLVITAGGYSGPALEKRRKVIAVATDPILLKELSEVGAEISKEGNPIVGTAGLLVGLARFYDMRATCLLGETQGFAPDLNAAKSLLEVLSGFLKIKIDLSSLEKEARSVEGLLHWLREIGGRIRSYEEVFRESEKERITYIS